MDDQHPNAERAYTRKQWKRAVNLSAVLGWLSIAVPISAGMNSAGLLQFFSILIWAAAIGLPIAFIASWLIAAPILNRLMRKNISWFQAAIWGGAITFLIALASIAIGRFRGWIQSVDPSSFSQLGGGDTVREIDGILTSYGWLNLAQNTATFVAIGMVISLVVRFAIGPGGRIS
ncbi:hypothetical protein [Phaeobacter inhibens]|uniref:hypothetical protein n=1 Tax=Phaeobacter inhibens TaxID=221822 RepID=UPI0021A89217|nr:hypothetical protein [Phaeobacter inhibens]